MAYQTTQPCLPPPIAVPHCPPEATGSCAAAECGSSPCALYRSVQPCNPLPIAEPACPAEGANTCSLMYVSPCSASCAEPCCAACEEVTSSPCGSPGCLTLAANVPSCTTGVAPRATLHYSDYCDEVPRVKPGSTVCLETSGRVTVKPGPAAEEDVSGSIIVGSYTPHFSSS